MEKIIVRYFIFYSGRYKETRICDVNDCLDDRDVGYDEYVDDNKEVG